MFYVTQNPEVVEDRDYTVEFNAKYSFNFSEDVKGYFKTGFKYRDKSRERDVNEYRTDYGIADSIGQANSDKFNLTNDGKILMTRLS